MQEYKNENEFLRNENESLKHEDATFKHQLDWFKQRFIKQVPGEKSEKLLIDNPDQLALGEILKDIVPQPEGDTETITCERRKKQRPEDSVTNQGLRCNDSVPVEVIHMPAPEMQGEDADQYEIIDHKDTYRLAQRSGSCVILQYQRLEARGVTISHGTLTNLEQRAAQLLEPVAKELLNSCLKAKPWLWMKRPEKPVSKARGK